MGCTLVTLLQSSDKSILSYALLYKGLITSSATRRLNLKLGYIEDLT